MSKLVVVPNVLWLALLAAVLGCAPAAPPAPPAVKDADTKPAPPTVKAPEQEKATTPETKTEEPKAATEEKGKTGGLKVEVDADLVSYKPVTGISGSIKSVGSDTMNNLMTKWGEGFKKFYPNVTVGVEGKGSGTAMPALISGQSNFGPLSRNPKKDEIASFEKAFGYKPVVIPTSLDLLAVFVHKDNPIKGLTLPQVDAMFSATRKLGYNEEIGKWGQVGLTEDWAEQPVSMYGRNAASGTYGFFKEHALGNGDFKDAVKVQPGSSGVVQSIGSEKNAIGYSGIGYSTADVRAVPLAVKEGDEYIAAVPENAYNRSYPLSRALLLAVNKNPNEELDPLRREFIKYILSKEGQQDVAADGYLPLPAKTAAKALEMVGLGGE
jgi:phosphate transport system substrate-binding protein